MDHRLLLEKIGVVGAAGKMGSGIALLLLQEMARVESACFGAMGKRKRALVLIDTSDAGLDRLKIYLRDQLQKYAEKNIIALRRYFANHPALVSNREIIDYFVVSGMDIIATSSEISEMRDVTWAFEAISEDVEDKAALFTRVDSMCRQPPLYFTNTSAIPISVLNDKANLQGRIIGFHFYNPPAVQTVLELIPLEDGNAALTSLACDIGKWLGKNCIFSHDVAGFIGNGYLLREVTAGCRIVRDLQQTGISLSAAVAMVDHASAEFCLRPMGIFQLVEYVGFELILKIGAIMNTYLPKPIYGADFESFLKECRPFFKHKSDLSSLLGALPEGYRPWKMLSNDVDKVEKIQYYLQQLHKASTPGAAIAKKLLKETAEIAEQLVQEHVAMSLDDVDMILKEGFYHLYGAKAFSEFNSMEPTRHGML